MDIRHQHRVKLIQELFADSFKPDQTTDPDLKQILSHLSEIDKMIHTYASRYPLDKIAKVDLAILRLSIYELMFEKKNPTKVVIDEAVILAKEFGNEKSYAFVNGVLGSVIKDLSMKK